MLMHWAGGGGGLWFPLFPLFWIAIVVVAVLLYRRSRPRWQSGRAEEIIGERYARGEISAEEYRERRAELHRKGA